MIKTQTPDQRSADTVAEASPPYVEDKLDDDGLGYEGECPICAAHRDPVTGEELFNAETAAAIEEGKAILRGEIPVEWHKPQEFEKVWQALLNEEVDG